MENQKNERALPVESTHDDERAVGAVRPRARHGHEQELASVHEGGHQVNNQAASAAGKNREEATSQSEKASTKVSRSRGPEKGNLQRLRVERMMSKAELARRAGVSTLTIDRVERGLSCRMDTKRKILEALGLKPSDRDKVFGPEQSAWLGAGGTTGPHKETRDHRSARQTDELTDERPDESEDLEE